VIVVAGAVWAGVDEFGAALARFWGPTYVLVLLLTLVNYGLRFWKWRYLTGRLGVKLPLREDAVIFASGLAMVLSPGKAGELLKPYLVRERTGVPMARTIPALITERLTDGIAALMLAAISVSTYAGEHAGWVYGTIGGIAVGIGILSYGPASLATLHLLRRLPGLGRIGAKLEEMYVAMRICVAPVPLVLTLLASMVAWGAECVGYKLVFAGFGHDASLDLSTFLYAFATAAGGLMPGGLGVADAILVGLPVRFIPGLDEGTSLASALLIRVATLWFGVLIGAGALVMASRLLDHPLEAPPKLGETPSPDP
jgi:hypothetical protein